MAGARPTHWNWCDDLARDYTLVTVDRDPIYVRDGNCSHRLESPPVSIWHLRWWKKIWADRLPSKLHKSWLYFCNYYSGFCPIASVISSFAWLYSSCDCKNSVLASSSRAAAKSVCERSALPS